MALVALCSALSLLVFLALPRIEHYFLVQAGANQAATLRLAVEGLRLTLQRHAPIPNLIAARPEIRALLADPNDPALKEGAEQLLEETAIALGASGVYLEDADGNALVAVPPIDGSANNELSYRPYFSQAVAGGLGQYYALGTQSGERGFFYASPVRDNLRINGVVAVKFSVDQFEATWRSGPAEIIVRDANDIVFMSSRADWNFRAMTPLSPARMALIEAANQFPVSQLTSLPNRSEPLEDKLSVIEIDDGETTQSYVSSTSLIARAGWRVTILTPTSDAFALARTTALSLLLLVLLAAVLSALMWQRRTRQAEKLAAQHAAQELLERRVAERTAELNEANTQLIAEVEERKTAEQQLRKTQTELIQAGKLAALGQMSAAISHELNQPLAAVKAYAENAVTFLQRGRSDDAEGNVRHISSLADRMSSIAKHLRNFARRPQEEAKPVSLLAIIDDALALMQPRLSGLNTIINFDRPTVDVIVVGGQVRLQHVVVNLISNALDAMHDDERPNIDLKVVATKKQAKLIVRDHGPGLSDDVLKLLFDPFFTTKDPGKGLGLGLSISYNIVRDFGGNLSATNHDEGGAEFTVSLNVDDQQSAREAAE
ncbi:MAG: ATP-binding protein [Pseudomonadota bacterium]